VSLDEWLVLLGGLALIGAVNWWFFGRWPNQATRDVAHHH
jgi:hypothetical protein